MSLPVVTAENYYSPEMNMAYMGSTQFKAFEKCEAAALAELKGEYHPPSSTALLVGGYIDAWFSGELPLYQAQHPEIFKRDGTLKAEYLRAKKFENNTAFFEYVRQRDAEVSDGVDRLFGEGAAAAVFQGHSAHAMAEGLPLWTNFFLSVIDTVPEEMSKQIRASKPRVEKYLKKYHR